MTRFRRSLSLAAAVALFALAPMSGSLAAGAEKDTKAAAEAKPDKPKKADPLVVPDGTPAELVKYLGRVQRHRIRVKTMKEYREQYPEFMSKKSKATLEAADKILASDEATKAEQKIAATAKLRALSTLARMGDKKAIEAVDTLAKEFDELGLTESAKKAELLRLQIAFNQSLKDAPGAQPVDEVIAEIKEKVAGKPTRDSLMLIRLIVTGTQRADKGETDRALALCDEFTKLFADDESEEATKIVARLEGMARRMQLMGSTMDISGTKLDGKPLDWDSYKGKVVLVQFWATWCGPCRGEIPHIKEQYEAYRDRGFEVVAISLDRDREKLEKYVEEHELPWPTLFEDGEDNAGWDAPMAIRYAVSGIPTLILLDQQGKVVCERARGPKLAEELEKLLGPIEKPEKKEAEQEDKKED